jgi:neutral ceramidase
VLFDRVCVRDILKRFATLAFPLVLQGCLGSDPSTGPAPGSGTGPVTMPSEFSPALPSFTDALNPAFLAVGNGLDAPGRLEFDLPARGGASGACGNNNRFRFGAGLHDVTGPVANTGGAGWEDPMQILSGLHTRMYSRAFAIDSACDARRLMFVSVDVGLMFGSIRQGVLAAVAGDSVLGKLYTPENIMLSATHTHQGPAGYGHHDGFNAFHYGFDEQVLNVLIDGIVQSMRKAHGSLLTQQEPASIRMVIGELLNANINRSKPAFAMNSEAERQAFVNEKGQEIQVDKRVVQLNLFQADGRPTGIINWFGVHPTTIGQRQTLVSSDNKGFASLALERVFGTRYDTPLGGNTFVAAFAQKDEGDASPNIFIEQFPTPDPRRGGGRDDFENNAIAGSKQLAKAIDLIKPGAALTGPLDYRLINVKMDAVEVTDPVVLSGLKHPAEQNAARKRTCVAALGVSFGGGAEDGPGPTVEGISCKSSPDAIAAAQRDFAAAMAGKVPPALLSTGVLCNLNALPGVDLGCHAEKPVLFVVGGPTDLEPTVIPMQMFRIGNLAIVGLPWEVTTIAARRLRKTLFDVLLPVGVDTIVIAGLVNDYTHYLTTREEYASQQYEGASNIWGPWTLAAVLQETRKMAKSLAEQTALAVGPAYVDVNPRLVRTPYVPSDQLPSGRAFGDLLVDVPAMASTGDTVFAEFQSAHPRNDLRLQASYVYVEKQGSDGLWRIVAQDRDPELRFVWIPQRPPTIPLDTFPTGPSSARAVWIIPCRTEPGRYRLRHVASAQTAPNAEKMQFEGISSTFEVGRSVTCSPPSGVS